jgi:hypothetical protein
MQVTSKKKQEKLFGLCLRVGYARPVLWLWGKQVIVLFRANLSNLTPLLFDQWANEEGEMCRRSGRRQATGDKCTSPN